MKFLVYANLNDNYSVSNCREISKKRARAFNPPPSRTKFPKIPVGIELRGLFNCEKLST